MTRKSSDWLCSNYSLLIFIAFATSCFLFSFLSSVAWWFIEKLSVESSMPRRNNRRRFKVPETPWTFLWTLTHLRRRRVFDREATRLRSRSHCGEMEVILTFPSIWRRRGEEKFKKMHHFAMQSFCIANSWTEILRTITPCHGFKI